MIKYYDMVSKARSKSFKLAIGLVLGFFLITTFFPKHQSLISIPFILLFITCMLPYLKTSFSVRCPSCGERCVQKNKIGVVLLKCENCKSEYE